MKTAEIAIIFIIGTLTLLIFVFFLVLIIIEYRKRQVRHITEKLELKHRYQNEVLQTQIEVQEQSFKYVSEELHDNIAQVLSLVKLKLYKTANKTTDETVKTGIAASNELLAKTMDDIRNLSHVLNGGLVSRMGLAESIEKELAYVRDANDMQATLTVNGTPTKINENQKLLAFRIVQEAVNNAIKHGKARQISVSLAYGDDNILLQVQDYGKGFDTRLINDSKGLGLRNMQERAKLLGSVEVHSEEGKGTTILLNIRV